MPLIDTTTFDTPNSTQTFTVGDDVDAVTQLLIKLNGAGGGGGGGVAGAGTGGPGGTGGYAEGTVPVANGDGFTTELADKGADAEANDGGGGTSNSGGAGGASPFTAGANGGDGEADADQDGGGGGGGGGASRTTRDSDSTDLATTDGGGGGGGDGGGQSDEGAGGGGGGGAQGGTGGAAGSAEANAGGDASGTGAGGDGGDGGSATGNGASGTDGGATVAAALNNTTTTAGGGNAAAASVVFEQYGVTGLSVDSATDSSVTISWNDAPNEDSYEVQYRETGASTWTTFSTGLAAGTTAETVTGLSDGTEYEFRVGATTTAGTSYTGAVTQATDLTAPSGIDVENADADNDVPGTSADIAWTDNTTNEDGYRVYLSTDQFTTKTNVSGDLAADTESYTESGLRTGERYQVGVAVFTADVEVLVTENV